MLRDRYGLSLSTSSAAATRAYVEGVDRFLAAHAAAVESFDHAVAADPGFALAHIGRSRSLLVAGRGPEGRAAAAAALALIREHVAEFPRDAMALAAANGVYGLIGFSGRQDRNEEMLALLASVAPAYGEDWWFLGAHGFARTEALGWKAGAPLTERALTLAPRNAHAAHAWAHVCYEQGADGDGAKFVAGWMPDYPKAGSLHCHLSWHRALFELGLGRSQAALALYDADIRPGASQCAPFSTLVDSASLLWRRELAGAAPAPGAWGSVADHARVSFPAIGVSFADVHCAVALAAAGDARGLARWVELLREGLAQGRVPAGEVVPTVAEAMHAFAEGRYEDVIRGLAPIVDQFVRVGGSWAQRDLFEHTLLAAYLRAGRPAEARALLARRIDRRPSVPVAGA